MSQHLGDMGSVETLLAFERSIEQFRSMYRIDPELLVTDLHPGYLTRRWAEEHTAEAVPVQHHHAHAAALMAEHGVERDAAVVAFAFDGTGYGTDGTVWGGEVLVARYDGFERAAHLRTIAIPGGDAGVRVTGAQRARSSPGRSRALERRPRTGARAALRGARRARPPARSTGGLREHLEHRTAVRRRQLAPRDPAHRLVRGAGRDGARGRGRRDRRRLGHRSRARSTTG